MEVISVILMFVFGNMNDQEHRMTQYIPMESMMSNTVNIKRAQQDIEKLLEDVEKLKDKVRENKNGGTNGSY